MLDQDSQTLTHFSEHTAEVVARLRQSGTPLLLTVDGAAAVVVQDAAAYQQLSARASESAAELDAFLRESLADADAGRTVPAKEFLRSLGTGMIEP